MPERKKQSGWLLAFAGIGIFAFTIQFLKTFFSFGKSISSIRADDNPDVGSPEFLEAVAVTLGVPIRRGGTVRLLNNGDGFYPVLAETIRGARHSIHIMTYIWRSGKISDLLFEALIERARNGVEVRLLIDGVGSLIVPWRHVNRLKKAGGQVAIFAPLALRSIPHFNQRNHARAYIIDGKTGFTGGMSVADQWLGNARNKNEWRDMMVEVHGPLVHGLQSAFAQTWANTRGEILVGPHYFVRPNEDDDRAKLEHIHIVNMPDDTSQPLLPLFWLSLNAARKRIYIANAYFYPDHHLVRLIVEKARQGVDIHIMTPGKHIDNFLVRWASHYHFDALLNAGVHLYEYQPSMMHSKFMIVDSLWVLTGSANLDIRSIKLNQENVLGIRDRDVAGSMEKEFERDLGRSLAITPELWKQRSWISFARTHLALPLKAQY